MLAVAFSDADGAINIIGCLALLGAFVLVVFASAAILMVQNGSLLPDHLLTGNRDSRPWLDTEARCMARSKT